MRDFTKPSPVWSAPWSVLPAVVCGLLALSVTSCRSTRTLCVQGVSVDSLLLASTTSVTVATLTEAVPGDSVTLRIPLSALTTLPEGAQYSRKAGRTRLTVALSSDSVAVTAQSDSLSRLTTRYTHLARDTLLRQAAHAEHTATSPTPSGRRLLPGVLRFAALLAFIAFVALLLRKR